MKKMILKLAIMTGLYTLMCAAVMAESSEACYVVGFHDPHTHVYNGPTICPNITLSSLTVRGPLQLNQTTIKGLTTVSGPIKAKGAKPQDIIVNENLTIGKVVLQSASTVYGNIEFKGKEGVVYLEAGSFVKGKVINGKIVNQESPAEGVQHEST